MLKIPLEGKEDAGPKMRPLPLGVHYYWSTLHSPDRSNRIGFTFFFSASGISIPFEMHYGREIVQKTTYLPWGRGRCAERVPGGGSGLMPQRNFRLILDWDVNDHGCAKSEADALTSTQPWRHAWELGCQSENCESAVFTSETANEILRSICIAVTQLLLLAVWLCRIAS